jgi:hypothetical protein
MIGWCAGFVWRFSRGLTRRRHETSLICWFRVLAQHTFNLSLQSFAGLRELEEDADGMLEDATSISDAASACFKAPRDKGGV